MKIRKLNLIFLCAILCCVLCFLPVFSAEAQNIQEQISKIETSLWGLNYSKESDSVRLNRIEKEVFGTHNSKASVQNRINKINSALGMESLAQAKAPVSELYEDEEEGVSYPAIDMLELQLLGKNYKSENIYKRLERLEGKVFGSSQKGDLAQRTDGLKAKISMMKPSSSLPSYQSGEYYREYTNTPAMPDENDVISKARRDAENRSRMQDYDAYSYGGSDASLQIAGLENSLFGQTFSYDPLPVRLNRLERRIFQRDFASDDDYARVERLQAAATAKKTAKYYEQNKLQKFASTGMQIGMFVLMILGMIL